MIGMIIYSVKTIIIDDMTKEFWNSERLIKLGRMSSKKTIDEISHHFNQPKKVIKQLCKQYGFPIKRKNKPK